MNIKVRKEAETKPKNKLLAVRSNFTFIQIYCSSGDISTYLSIHIYPFIYLSNHLFIYPCFS